MDVGTPLARLIRWLVPIDDSPSHSGRAEQFVPGEATKALLRLQHCRTWRAGDKPLSHV